MSEKLWGGRFVEDTHRLASAYSASVHVDKRLAPQDIRGSLAHVAMLKQQGILSLREAKKIESALNQIAKEVSAGTFEWRTDLEDVHMNIEAMLIKRLGSSGGRLHTARSRNDQVATDMRLWTREAADRICQRIDDLLHVLCKQAEQHIDTLMPAYTHLQRAQPTRLAHHLLAWTEMFERDRSRFLDAARRLNECPLGAGALTTTTFPIDRHHTADALGFTQPMRNSLDAVSDRDYLIEILACLANTALHMSRIAEELVLWSSQEFGFVDVGDAFSTGSSMMPQKKNPDMAELIRGKTGRVIGSLVSLIVTLKGLPLTYNRDLQEDKEPVFDAFDTVSASLEVLTAMLETAEFKPKSMREALADGYTNATEVADYLVNKGIPFRQAHALAANLVEAAARAKRPLEKLSLQAMRTVYRGIDEDIFVALAPEVAIERRNVFGGPAKSQVRAALRDLKKRLKARTPKVSKRRRT
ncbi:MAG: argininosuccinate lyase [Myxococcales bacterium]|nr:argininosuccinate lyase [Myxococcales bacterium]MCB9708008.1 argininosuccinate lyase [Myxococcales bacterium]